LHTESYQNYAWTWEFAEEVILVQIIFWFWLN
jgi:hypothetical protein